MVSAHCIQAPFVMLYSFHEAYILEIKILHYHSKKMCHHLICVNLVLECVSTSSFSILVNGGQMETFKPSSGIGQGDLLSLYLFILYMEYLSLKILELCENNN